MVQLKVQNNLVKIKVVSKFPPSLSDCLEKCSILRGGLAVKGTWKTVSSKRKHMFHK